MTSNNPVYRCLANEIIAGTYIALYQRFSCPGIGMNGFAVSNIIKRIGILAGARLEDRETMRDDGGHWAFFFIGKANCISLFNIPAAFLGKFALTVIGCSVGVKALCKFMGARSLARAFINIVNGFTKISVFQITTHQSIKIGDKLSFGRYGR